MSEMDNNKIKEYLFWIIIISAGFIGVYLWLAHFGNLPEKYKDVIISYTSFAGSNKTAERNLVYTFSLVGSAFVFVFYLLFNKKNNKLVNNKISDLDTSLIIGFAFALSAIVNYLIYDEINWWIGIILYFAVLFIFCKQEILTGIIFAISFVYALCGMYRLYVFCGGKSDFSIFPYLLLLVFPVLIINYLSKKNLFNKMFLLIQILIPMTLLIFISSNYKYNDNLIIISTPVIVKIFISLIIFWFVLLSVIKLKNNWNNVDISKSISFSTICCIMNFNRYSGTGAIVPNDLHHPFENIIAFSQSLDFGRIPYSSYVPVSGLYSFLQGMFFAVFGEGKFSYYYVSENIFYFVAILLIVYLLIKQIDIRYAFIIALFIPIITYNRVLFIIPIFLLLSWDKLIEKKNLWIAVWFLTSLFNGLYYPLFGAAVCLGFMPLGIWQIITYYKSGQLKKDYKKERFLIVWSICIFLVVINISLLIGSFKHILAMSEQTVYADGISRFAQVLPDNFMANIKHMGARLLLYNEFTFLTQILIVCFSVCMSMKLGGVYIENHGIRVNNPKLMCLSVSIAIVILISFSYTIIPLDKGIYARNAGVIYAACFEIILLCIKHVIQNKKLTIIIMFVIFLISIDGADAYNKIEEYSKLDACYTVPENYIFIQNDNVKRLGDCFMDQSSYELVKENYNNFKGIEKNVGFMGIGRFGMFYLCDLRGDSVMENLTVKGYGATKETVDIIRESGSFITGIKVRSSYYLYRWLITSGEYIYLPETGIFYPNEGTMEKEDILVQNKTIDLAPEAMYLERIASSLGLSYKDLQSVLEKNKVDFSVENLDQGINVVFDKIVNGNDADFMYIEFKDMDK